MRRDTRIVAAVLGTIAAAIAAGSLLCAAAIAAGASPQWRLLFRLFCHGMAERSLVIFGETMPICARCFGIYAGLLAGLAIPVWRWISERTARVILMVATVPMALDGLTQVAGFRTSTNPLRLATGVLAAIAFATWALAAVEQREERAEMSS